MTRELGSGDYIIPAGATGLGPKLDISGSKLVGIIVPTGWVAADITFQGSVDDGTNWFNIHDSGGTEVKVTTGGATRYFALSPDTFTGVRWVRLRSGTAAVAVDQTAARTLKLVNLPF